MKKFKVCLSALLSILIVSSCSSGNPTTPNRGTLTNLSKNPATNTEAELKKINLSGRVIDSVTRKPVEGANILLYVISNDEILKKVKEGLKSLPTEMSSPLPSASSLAPNPTDPLNPSINPNPEKTPNLIPDANTIISPSPTTSSSPNTLEENEESVVATPQPTLVPTAKPTSISPVDLLNKPKDIATPPKPAMSASPAPTSTETTDDETLDEEIKNLSEELLSSALTTLKLNDIQEFEGKTGNDGKFWISKVPDTSVIITVNAPNYKSASIFNLDTNKVEDILIDPIEVKKDLLPVYGNVYSAVNTAINNATVSASYPIGETFSIPVNSDSEGKFKIEDIKEGDRTFLATVKEPSGKITSMGFIDYDIKKGGKYTAPLKTEPKKPDASLATDKSVPNIKVKSVTEYITVKGKIPEPENNILKTINVYMTFKKKGLPKEEVFVTDIPIEAKSENFEITLPKLDTGYSYHLEFVAVNKKGAYIYHHQNNVKASNKEMKISFISGISSGKVDFIEKEGEKLPIFSWTPVTAANYYRVSIDKMDKNNNLVTVWEGLTPFNTAVYPVTTGTGKLSSTNKYFWNVVAIKEGSVTTERLNYGKLSADTWTDLASSSNMEFSLENNKEDEVEEIESKK